MHRVLLFTDTEQDRLVERVRHADNGRVSSLSALDREVRDQRREARVATRSVSARPRSRRHAIPGGVRRARAGRLRSGQAIRHLLGRRVYSRRVLLASR